MQQTPEQYLLNTLLILHKPDPDFNKKSILIKQLFKKRDFVSIFTNQELLLVYALEHSSSRALCYRDFFLGKNILKVQKVCVLGGGNGAELLGIISTLSDSISPLPDTISPSTDIKYEFIVQDLSDYQILDTLFQHITSRYSFHGTLCKTVGDLLDMNYLKTLDFKGCGLITVCYLLNELYTTSKSLFVQFITFLVTNMPQGCLLVVIDSAGSFSSVTLSKEYMLFHLLDQIQSFEIVEKGDSQWYRYPVGLEYPLKLDNMRYFYRLYRKK